MGTNRLVGTRPEAAVEAARKALSEGARAHKVPPLWDGAAAERIADILARLDWRAYRTDTGRAPGAG
jgi:UDP-N-acetylglucosamine 2-epimerase (non-hydrolysing)